MAKITVSNMGWDNEVDTCVYEGDYDATVAPGGDLFVVTTSLKPSIRAIYAKGCWDKVEMEDE